MVMSTCVDNFLLIEGSVTALKTSHRADWAVIDGVKMKTQSGKLQLRIQPGMHYSSYD